MGNEGTTRIEIPGATLARVAVAVLLTFAAARLFSSLAGVLVIVMLAIVIAVALSGYVDRLQRKGLSRSVAALVALVTVLLLTGAVLIIVVPPMFTELKHFLSNAPHLAESLRDRLSGDPALGDAIVERIADWERDPSQLLTGALQYGISFASLTLTAIVLISLATYLLVEHEQVHATLLRFTPRAYRERVDESLAGMAGVIRAYFIGRSIVSAIFAVFTFLLLELLHVPYTTVLAVLAFVFGAIPHMGALLVTVLPAAIALAARDLTTAIIVVAAMLVYQQIENNFIHPQVMSRRLQVSTVATLLAVLIGGKLLGVIGVMLAIPLAGMLPVLERIWIHHEDDQDVTELTLREPMQPRIVKD